MGLSERCKVRRGAVDERKALVDFGLQRARLERLDPQLELRCVHRASAAQVPTKRQFKGRGMDEEWTRDGGGMGWEVSAAKSAAGQDKSESGALLPMGDGLRQYLGGFRLCSKAGAGGLRAKQRQRRRCVALRGSLGGC